MARILLADDDDDMVEICSRLMPRKGHQLLIARNAADAVQLAQAQMPDLILMDMRMPLSAEAAVDDWRPPGGSKLSLPSPPPP